MMQKKLEGKKLVFLGDSITEGYGLSNIEQRYADLIASDEKAICFIDRVEELEADADQVMRYLESLV